VDKLLVFVAPRLAGAGPGYVDRLDAPLPQAAPAGRRVGEDDLLEAYLREP
jgi:hypothetical protein